MPTTVCVTMFFDLKSLPDATTTVRPVEFYVNNGKTTLSTQAPMVIFCDSETRPWIEKIRQEAVPTQTTLYIEKNITDYDFYKLNHGVIKENRNQSSGYKDPNERNTPSYCITTTFKFLAMKMAKQAMQASHYAWLDFGCAHIADQASVYIPKMLENPHPKMSCAYIHYRPSHALRDMKSYLMHGNPCSLAATVFTIQSEYVDLAYIRAMSVFYEQLSKGVGHNEEGVFVYLYDRYPDMFTLYYGDYYSCLTNYHHVHRDYNTIKYCFIQEALNSGKLELAKTCASKLLESVQMGTLILPVEEIQFLSNV
jgi:hypothetical protein